MTDSTTSKGWMPKLNFNEAGKDPIEASVCANAMRRHAQLFIDAKTKGYSQWFAGKLNNVLDALSWDWHREDNKLTSILCLNFPQQNKTEQNNLRN
jgi:hypothetical protein